MKNKKLKLMKIFAFLLFASMLFFNHSTVMNVMASQDMGMISGESNKLMPCCDMETPFSSMSHHLAILSSSNNNFLKFISILFISTISLFLVDSKRFDFRAYSYTKRIRESYGSWRCFDTFLNLFRLGILHPKTF